MTFEECKLLSPKYIMYPNATFLYVEIKINSTYINHLVYSEDILNNLENNTKTWTN